MSSGCEAFLNADFVECCGFVEKSIWVGGDGGFSFGCTMLVEEFTEEIYWGFFSFEEKCL